MNILNRVLNIYNAVKGLFLCPILLILIYLSVMSQFWFINLIMDYVSLPLCIPANLWLGVIVNFKLLTLYSGLRLFENCLMLWVLVLTGEVLRLGLITPHHRGKAFLGLYLMPWELWAFPIWLVVSDSFQPHVNTRHCFLSSFWVVLSLALDGFPIEHCFIIPVPDTPGEPLHISGVLCTTLSSLVLCLEF